MLHCPIFQKNIALLQVPCKQNDYNSSEDFHDNPNISNPLWSLPIHAPLPYLINKDNPSSSITPELIQPPNTPTITQNTSADTNHATPNFSSQPQQYIPKRQYSQQLILSSSTANYARTATTTHHNPTDLYISTDDKWTNHFNHGWRWAYKVMP